MAFSTNQYDKAVMKWMEQNTREVSKHGDKLHKLIADDMLRNGLPTVISAGISFQRLQEAGKLKRVDGKTEDDDARADFELAQDTLERVIADVNKDPLTTAEIEYFASLSPRELSRLYFGEDGDAVNPFAIRFRRAMREQGFREPLPFADQVQS